MKKINLLFFPILICSLLFFVSCEDNKVTLNRAGIMSADFVKEKLTHPQDAEFNDFDIRGEQIDDTQFKVLRKFTAKNSFGVSTEYVYKCYMTYIGGESGDWADSNNWICSDLIIENVQTGEQYE